MKTVYQVRVRNTDKALEFKENHYIFSKEQLAIECVKYFFDNSYDPFTESPFAGYDENQQKLVTTRRVVDDDGNLTTFESEDVYYGGNLLVEILEKPVDTKEYHWEF